MPKSTAKAETVQLPPDVQERLNLLEGFKDIVHERFGYLAGRKVKQTEMSDATKKESKAVNELSKTIRTKTAEFLDTPTTEIKDTIVKAQRELGKAGKDISGARKVLRDVKSPFLEKIKPLNKAIRYMDGVVIPDSLKELGKPLQPMFQLSKWVNDALEATKKK